MRKILPSIFIFLILVNIFAPFTVGLGKNNIPEVKKSIAEAEEMNVDVFRSAATGTSLELTITSHRKETTQHQLYYLFTDQPGTTLGKVNGKDLNELVNDEEGYLITTPEQVFIPPAGAQKLVFGKISLGSGSGETTDPNDPDFQNKIEVFSQTGLTKSTDYYMSLWGYNGTLLVSIADSPDNKVSTTNGDTDNTSTQVGALKTHADPMPECGVTSGAKVLGCLAVIFYYALFNPTSWLFAKAGIFFDWAFDYSVKPQAYTDTFVVEGWGVVRDFCNIFFIFVLLYIAFATILSLHGFKTKEMIINVVIIGLLINFSLFATQMIIDTSNILARVFYNAQSLDIKVIDKETNKPRDPKPGEPLQMSLAVVNKFDPQELILNAKNVAVADKGKQGGTNSIGAGTFIIVTLLATAVNVIGFIVFLVVALLFIGRVVGLWIAMILVPLAFFSYTVPSMQDIDMIGWRKWWPNTLKLAFLAPIFMFFMYLIIKFLKIDFITSAGNKDGMDFVLSIIVPFAFIMILMWKAKGIAQKLSGDFGAAMTKIGAMAGGVALGGAAMVGAGALRGTIGRAGSAIDKSAWVNRNAAKMGGVGMIARSLKSVGQTAGKGSMDIRGAKIAGMGLASTGLTNLGKANEGGFEKMRADKVASRKKRADDLKVHEDEPLKQNLNKAQVDKQKLLLESEFNISQLENQLKAARDKARDANLELNAAAEGPEKEAARLKSIEATALVSQLTTTKKEIKDAKGSEIESITVKVEQARAELASAAPEDKKKFETKVKNAQMVLTAAMASRTLAESKGQDLSESKSINDYEDIIIPNAEHEIHHENLHRLSDRADLVQSKTNKVINFIFSGGQHSSAGADEAAHAMRMDLKISGGDKAHGGGGGGHAPKAPKPKAKADDGHGGGGGGGGGAHAAGHH